MNRKAHGRRLRFRFLIITNQEKSMQTVHRTIFFTLALVGLAGGLAASAQSGPLQFVAISPCRIVDTRNTGNPIQGNTSQNFAVQGSQGSCSNIPATAAAYSLNVTVVPHGSLNYLTVWPAGEMQPVVSTLNSLDGRIKANAAIVGAGSGAGAVSVYATNTTDVILDLDGYFETAVPNTTLAFFPVAPCRVADTRNSGGPLPGGQEMDFPVSGLCNIPSSAMAYSLNLTAIPYEPLNFLSVWPAGQSQPMVSTLNSPGTVVANAAMVGAGKNGEVAVYPTDKIDLVMDINGYYALASSGPGGLSLYTLTPCRVLDTRPNGQFSGTLAVNAVVSSCGLPSLAQAIVANATVVPPGPLGYLTLWANGQSQPLASTLNAYDGAITSNLAVVPTSNGFIDAYASAPTQLLVDLFGYFALPSGLSGNYTFTVNGFNNPSSGHLPPPPCESGGQFLMVGSFVADGNANINGLLDLNCTGGQPVLHLNFTGTYSIQSNGLGTITMTPTLNPPFHLSVAISSTGDGRLALQNESSSYLPTAWGSGAIRLQNPADLSLQQIAGNFASGFSGADSALNRYAGAGAYQINATGNVQGSVDTNDAGMTQNSIPTAGTLQAPDPNTGRGFAIFVTSGITTNWVYYITSANEVSFLSKDPLSSAAPLLLRTMLRQSSGSFDNTSLNGVSVLRTSGIAQSLPDIVLGLFTTDGAGNGSISYDENKGGTLSQQQTAQGTYTVASNGRVALTGFGSSTPPLFYLVQKNQAFVLSQDASVASGFFLQQSGSPFTNASAIGNYWGGTFMPVTAGVTDSVAMAFSDSNGNLTGTINTSGPTGTGTQSLMATYQIDSTGRAVLSGVPAAIMYVISPTQVALLPAADPNPAGSAMGSTN
jgi:hypothetical protein